VARGGIGLKTEPLYTWQTLQIAAPQGVRDHATLLTKTVLECVHMLIRRSQGVSAVVRVTSQP
jgi:hypothetical protein